MKNLRRDSIAEYVDFYEDPLINKTYLVMKNAGGRSIDQFVREQRVDVDSLSAEKPWQKASFDKVS